MTFIQNTILLLTVAKLAACTAVPSNVPPITLEDVEQEGDLVRIEFEFSAAQLARYKLLTFTHDATCYQTAGKINARGDAVVRPFEPGRQRLFLQADPALLGEETMEYKWHMEGQVGEPAGEGEILLRKCK